MARAKAKSRPAVEPVKRGPFLEILTRTFGQRPDMLDRCKESVALLGPDVAHHIIIDEECHGVAWANRNLSTVKYDAWSGEIDIDVTRRREPHEVHLAETVDRTEFSRHEKRAVRLKRKIFDRKPRWPEIRPLPCIIDTSVGVVSRDTR